MTSSKNEFSLNFLFFRLATPMFAQEQHWGSSSADFTGLRIDISAGKPVEPASDISEWNVNGNVMYRFQITDGLYTGPVVGYYYNFGNTYDEDTSAEVDSKGVNFSLFGLSTNMTVLSDLTLGGDFGYGKASKENFATGLFYRLKIGANLESGAIFYVSFLDISNSETESEMVLEENNFTSVNVGVEIPLSYWF